MKLTIIVMYRGDDAEMFTQVVEGELTEEQRKAWRQAHFCDEFYNDGEEDEDGDTNNMFFRTVEAPLPNGQTADLLNVDGEAPPEKPEAPAPQDERWRQFSIHVSDWNMNDRVIFFPDAEQPLGILRDTSLAPRDRMSKLYNTASHKELDPRASDIDNADFFVEWPDSFMPDSQWEAELADNLAELESED